jgi:hypothetical protein
MRKPGAIPEGTHDGSTEPMEVDEIRKADPIDTFQGAPTQELPTVAVEDAGDVS